MNDLLKQHLARAQLRMKVQADKHRTERTFQVGEMVYLKLQPYIQSTVQHHSSNKLLFKCFGPFEILDKVGSVAHKLQLPPSSAIHPIFHVSQLKKAPGSNKSVSADLPDLHTGLQVPVKVLQRRMITRGTTAVHQVLIQWSHQPASLATWEDTVTLKQKFPQAPAWRQAGAQGGGIVTDGPGPATTTTVEPMANGRGKLVIRPNTRVTGQDWVR